MTRGVPWAGRILLAPGLVLYVGPGGRRPRRRRRHAPRDGCGYWLAPTNINHTWTEVRLDDRWVALEGVILDAAYLDGLRRAAPIGTTAFIGYGVGTANLDDPPVDWRGSDTWIQRTGVNQDFGAYDDPDAYYAEHGDNLSGLRAWLYRRWIRHVLNRNVAKIRQGGMTIGAVSTSRNDGIWPVAT